MGKKKKKKQAPRKKEVEMISIDPLAKPERGKYHWAKVAGIVLLAVIILGGGALKVFVDGTAGASDEALALSQENQKATGIDNALVFGDPESADVQTALIFYPMNRTDYQAYACLAKAIVDTSNGRVLCIVPELTLSMTTLSTDAADAFISKYPNVKNWYVGGHYTGGDTAATYAAKHTDSVRGVVLVASYSENDIHQTGLRVLVVRATEDGILNMGKFNACLDNLPETYHGKVIEGGNFAQFADFGEMANDGEASITRDEQQRQTADAIVSFVLEMVMVD